ncbi:DNA polymerase III subunit gamma and tau [Mycetocola zhujimingii]|uniref:DNA polymerase III subunit gamma and tau n=1 Tax=Mycetocola zhujimingii TaxID=2079792 RepID=UPI000D394A79|nr:DNA polymerase III subunit gamma and tau [Mycetocola zhujimingii]AWB85622.1 DNA polymerase III subunit gamma and tau [Mycetocola zhujimingii]
MVTALYRRYRPESFAELIGQSQVTDPLMTALRTNRVNHAYLFSGPRGCGKTTSARILARCLNCVEGPTDTPCGVCPSCVELSRDGGGSLDVVEIDAASHNGVDDARDLRERAVFAPARDRYKIFILDEAHMVTPQGFNALLKIVEEPPEHIKFIFATTEPDKVIGTIRSRTHHYPFRLIPPAQMLEYVQSLCESEGVKVEAGVLPLVVRAGGGSARDTLSLLDQLMAGSEGDTVDYERAVALLGYTHSALLDEVIDALAIRDSGAAFTAVDRVIQTGQDPRRFVDDLLERLRDLIVVGATGAEASAVLRGIPQDELDHMSVQATGFGQAELSRTADIVNTALSEMTGATSPRLHLELMVARVLVPSMDDSARGALARVERLERRVGMGDSVLAPPAQPAAPAAQPAAPAATPTAQRPVEAPVEPAAPAPARQAPAAEDAPPAPAEPVTVRPIGPVSLQQLKDAWPEILDRVAKTKRSSWLVATTASIRGFSDDLVLRLAFPSQTDVDDFKKLNAGEGVSSHVRQAILDVLGVSVKFIAQVAPPGDGHGGSSTTDAPPASPSAPGISPDVRPAAAAQAGTSSTSVAPVPNADPAPAGAPAASAEAPSVPDAAPNTVPDAAPNASEGDDPPQNPPAPPAWPTAVAGQVVGADAESRAARDAIPTEWVVPGVAPRTTVVAASTTPQASAQTATAAGPAATAAPATTATPVTTPTATAPARIATVAPESPAAPLNADGGWAVVAIPGSGGQLDATVAETETETEPAPSAGARPAAVPETGQGPAAQQAPARVVSVDPSLPGDDDAPPADDEPPYPDGYGDPYAEPVAIGDVTAGIAPAVTSPARAPQVPAAGSTAQGAPSQSQSPQQAQQQQQQSRVLTPAHPKASTRYGESVVREILGASFIEEQPHTPPTRFNRD